MTSLIKKIFFKPPGMKTLANVEKCKQAEKKILEEVEVLKQTHPVLQR